MLCCLGFTRDHLIFGVTGRLDKLCFGFALSPVFLSFFVFGVQAVVVVGFTDHPSNAGVLSDKQNLPLLLQSEGKGKPTCTSSPRSKALITAAGDKNPPSLTSIFVTSAAIASPVRGLFIVRNQSEPASSSLSPTLIPKAYRPTYFDLRVALRTTLMEAHP